MAELAHVTELLTDAVRCLEASPRTKRHIEAGIEATRIVCLRSLEAGAPRPPGALSHKAIQALRLLAKPSMRACGAMLRVTAKSLADRAEEEGRALARATGEEE